MQLKDLSPAQRATLKLLEGIMWTAIINAVFAFGTYLSNNQNIDYRALGISVGASASLAIVLAIAKYFKSHGQPLLSTAIEQAAQELIRRSGTNPVLEEEAPDAETQLKRIVKDWRNTPPGRP